MTRDELQDWAQKCMREYREAFGHAPELRALVPATDWPFNGFYYTVRSDEGGECVLMRTP